MVKRFAKQISLVVLICLLIGNLALPASAGKTSRYTMKVGETKYLYTDSDEAVISAFWSSSNTDAIQILDSNSTYCQIKAVGPSDREVLIHCEYYYQDLVGGYIYTFSDYTDYKITVTGDSSNGDAGNSGNTGGSGGSETGGSSGQTSNGVAYGEEGHMTVSPSNIYLDLAKDNKVSVRAQLTKGIPAQKWGFSFVYGKSTYDEGAAAVKRTTTEEGPTYWVMDFSGTKVGRNTMNVLFNYNNSQLDRAVINITVTCSHKWMKAEPTSQPTCTEDGVIEKRTCEVCGKEETIREIVPSLGHSFGEWEICKEPTTEETGIARRFCACGAYEDQTLNKLPTEEKDEPEDPKPEDPKPEDPKPEEPAPQGNPFEDVAEGKFYYEPVLWAYYGGITTGKDATHFNPSGFCTRSQVVTFLWRAAGEPEPTSSVNPFPDVPENKFYTKAVLWAVEQGITGGYKDGTFGPNDSCTRSQIVTFLWRYFGEPQPESTNNPFPDVPEGKFYTTAVLWAVEQGITGGYKDGTFGPNKTCTRDQIVTFLYRAMVE